jgi:hypothetical protein
VPRERELVLRDRDAALRGDLDAPPEAFFAPELVEAFRVPADALEPELDDLARVEVDLRALLARDPLDRDPLDLRAPLLRDDVEPDVVEPVLDPSTVHLPDMTRCAASATASAISEPSLVALATTLLAAWVAVSAASSPASRIARRAFGLALIAAAAAARPAASISLLIAAFASLSTVSLPDDDPDEPLDEDFAICFFSLTFAAMTLQGRNGSRMKRETQIC